MRAFRTYLLFAALIFSLAGCSVKQVVRGQYYLQSEKFEQGAVFFRSELAENPDSPSANYYMGRFLLEEKKPGPAARHLARALVYDPDNAEYHFWHGVALGESGREGAERLSYLAALRSDPGHLLARTYLANLQLKAGKYHTALANYQKVLEKRPYSVQALYNRALALNRLGRLPEETLAWKLYLSAWPEGALARKATQHLNALGDFTFRNHIMGKRTISLEKPAFVPFKAELQKGKSASLDRMGEIMARSPSLVLHLLVYQLKDPELARKRALAMKKYLTDHFDIGPGRIKPSWFSVPEKIRAGGKTYLESESFNFFGTKS